MLDTSFFKSFLTHIKRLTSSDRNNYFRIQSFSYFHGCFNVVNPSIENRIIAAAHEQVRVSFTRQRYYTLRLTHVQGRSLRVLP